MSDDDNIPRAAFQIVTLDTLMALIAGIGYIHRRFLFRVKPCCRTWNCRFHTLPGVFAKMAGGFFFAILFFILLSIAALTSSISLLKVVVSYFVDEKKWKRHNAAIVLGFIIAVIGRPSVLAFNILADFQIFNLNFFDLVDFLASNVLLPFGGLLISVFVAWIWGFDKVLPNLKNGQKNYLLNIQGNSYLENFPEIFITCFNFFSFFALDRSV